MATADTVRSAWQAQPFQPFTLAACRREAQYEARGREWISIPPAPRASEVLLYVVLTMPNGFFTDGLTSASSRKSLSLHFLISGAA